MLRFLFNLNGDARDSEPHGDGILSSEAERRVLGSHGLRGLEPRGRPPHIVDDQVAVVDVREVDVDLGREKETGSQDVVMGFNRKMGFKIAC